MSNGPNLRIVPLERLLNRAVQLSRLRTRKTCYHRKEQLGPIRRIGTGELAVVC